MDVGDDRGSVLLKTLRLCSLQSTYSNGRVAGGTIQVTDPSHFNVRYHPVCARVSSMETYTSSSRCK